MRLIGSLPGHSPCGFWGMFEEDFGDSQTPGPYDVVVPSKVGVVLLPFRCPKCKEVSQDLASAAKRERYHDKRPGRDNYWCPLCGHRFRIDFRGMDLPVALEPGAVCGPSKVVRGTDELWQDRKQGVAQTILGVLLGDGTKTRGAYDVLAQTVVRAVALPPRKEKIW